MIKQTEKWTNDCLTVANGDVSETIFVDIVGSMQRRISELEERIEKLEQSSYKLGFKEKKCRQAGSGNYDEVFGDRWRW